MEYVYGISLILITTTTAIHLAANILMILANDEPIIRADGSSVLYVSMSRRVLVSYPILIISIVLLTHWFCTYELSNERVMAATLIGFIGVPLSMPIDGINWGMMEELILPKVKDPHGIDMPLVYEGKPVIKTLLKDLLTKFEKLDSLDKLDGIMKNIEYMVDITRDVDARLKTIYEQHDEWGTCIICRGAPPKYAAMPCGHTLHCEPCAKDWHPIGCPICGTIITRKVKLYYS